VEQPPVDAIGLAVALRLTVAWDDAQQSRARCVRMAGARRGQRGAILLRPEPRQERRQWAVAHEIGEHFAWQVFAGLSLDAAKEEAGIRETIANRLASALLLPGEWFARDGAVRGWQLPLLKQRYATASHELIARRMLDCQPPVLVTIFDHGRRVFRAGNMQSGSEVLLPIEMACWRASHESGVPATRQQPGCAVQAWPIHEPGWRREIMRTSLDEWADW
ncbi:MAG: ImmA/IrrE family metallo-endopeptidase, partial [Pirellulales bacterium]